MATITHSPSLAHGRTLTPSHPDHSRSLSPHLADHAAHTSNADEERRAVSSMRRGRFQILDFEDSGSPSPHPSPRYTHSHKSPKTTALLRTESPKSSTAMPRERNSPTRSAIHAPHTYTISHNNTQHPRSPSPLRTRTCTSSRPNAPPKAAQLVANRSNINQDIKTMCTLTAHRDAPLHGRRVSRTLSKASLSIQKAQTMDFQSVHAHNHPAAHNAQDSPRTARAKSMSDGQRHYRAGRFQVMEDLSPHPRAQTSTGVGHFHTMAAQHHNRNRTPERKSKPHGRAKFHKRMPHSDGLRLYRAGRFQVTEERISIFETDDPKTSAQKRKPMRAAQRLSSLPHILYTSQGREKPDSVSTAAPRRSPRNSVLRTLSPASSPRRSSVNTKQHISPIHAHPLANPFRATDNVRHCTLSPLSSCPNSGATTPVCAGSRSQSPTPLRVQIPSPVAVSGNTSSDATTTSSAFNFQLTKIPRSVLATQKSAPEALQTPRSGLRVSARRCNTTSKKSRRRSLHVPHTVHVFRTPPVQRGRFSEYFEEEVISDLDLGSSGSDNHNDSDDGDTSSGGVEFESGANSSETLMEVRSPTRHHGRTSPPLGYDQSSRCTFLTHFQAEAQDSGADSINALFAHEMGFGHDSVCSSDSPIGAGSAPADHLHTETKTPTRSRKPEENSSSVASSASKAISRVAKIIGRFESKRASKEGGGTQNRDDASASRIRSSANRRRGNKIRRRRKSSEEEHNGERAKSSHNIDHQSEPFPRGHGRLGRRGTFSLYE